ADQRQMNLALIASARPFAPLDDEVLARAARQRFGNTQVAATPADRERLEARLARRRLEHIELRAVGVDHRWRALRQEIAEQLQLGIAVVVEVGVVIEVILRKVCERASGELHAMQAILR